MAAETDSKSTIAISSGDPAGIGPEVVVRALSDSTVRDLARWVVVGDQEVLAAACDDCRWEPDAVVDELTPDVPGKIILLDANRAGEADAQRREPTAVCGQASIDYVRIATELCLSGAADAMVTGPVSKEAVTLTGRQFTGHTEYIADLCGASQSRMLLVNDKMRVVHVTTHVSLEEASRSDAKRIFDTIKLGHETMQALGWPEPRIGVCGMNPHAGENGLFGNQEATAITPAIEQARAEGMDCTGPHPADTVFLQAYRGQYDLLVAMYHDQGHVPMKLIDFEHTVNISLGLPIVRTSVDHGTAFDIAGKGVANGSDMKSAMRFARRLVAARRQTA